MVEPTATAVDLAKEAGKVGFGLALRHWRVWDWLNGNLSRVTSGTKMPTSLRELWYWISNNYVRDGDYLELKQQARSATSWYITEWVPRLPGQIWFEDSAPLARSLLGESHGSGRLIEMDPKAIRDALHLQTAASVKNSVLRARLVDLHISEHSHWESRFFDPQRIGRSLIQQGLAFRGGIARPALSNNEDRFALMSVVTADEFFVDLGFPVLVSRQVYRKIMGAQTQAGAVQIEGNMQVREMLPSQQFALFLDAHDAPAENLLKTRIFRPIGVRTFVGEITSPLDISVRPCDKHPTGTIRVDGHDGNRLYERNGVILISRFQVQDPSKLPNLLDEYDFLIGEDHQFGTRMVAVTDFDARITRFTSAVPLARNPAKDKTVAADIIDSIAS